MFTLGILALWTIACATRFPSAYIKGAPLPALRSGVSKL